MARGLALVQFIIICLGSVLLHILGRLSPPKDSSGFLDSLGFFLGKNALWLIPVPILWAILEKQLSVSLGDKISCTIGWILTLLIFLLFAAPLFKILN